MLRAESITHSYGGLPVLENVSLDVRAGEFVSLVGPSGCGKSTLLKILGGLIAPAAGGVARTSERSGFVFQNPALLPWRTAAENAALPLELAGVPARDARRGGEDALARVGLVGFEDTYPSGLSGGMQQRAALARAFITSPDLLLMDEPFGALDELTRDRMHLELLRVRSRGVASPAAVVFVTHSVPEAVFLSDRVIVLSPRPARVVAEVAVPIPRPRMSEEIRYSPEFNALVKCVRECLTV